jgi:hypothetical protein
MVQKTYYKTKDYCKVKFTLRKEDAETAEILGLNSDWQQSVIMSRKKDGSFHAEVALPKDSVHEFRYRVNDTLWLNEPDVESTPNIFGTDNSVLAV